MIAREQMTLVAQGDRFFPSKVPAPYSSSYDPGALGKFGPNKGEPVPYGVADFEVPDSEKEKIAYLHRLVLPHLDALRAAGADKFRLHISYAYRDQCAIGFSRDEIKMLAELQCDVPIDCWRDDGSAEAGAPGERT